MNRSTDIVRSYPCPCGRSFGSARSLNMHGRVCGALTPEAKFWAKVDSSAGPEACWPWQGAITSHGYGCVAAGGLKVIGAHKAAYQYAKGPVPAGLEIMHACDNRPCCNPAHLGVGSRKDNSDDKQRKGRGMHGRSWHAHLKLSAADVHEIRKLRGVEPSGSLAARFNVEQPHIINIWNRKVWKSLP